MNCKPGDLAIIVGATKAPDNNGKIVEVVRPAVAGEVMFGLRVRPREASWIVRSIGSPLTITLAGIPYQSHERPYQDRFLRPIRPQPDDATDEMVLIAGKPAEAVCS